MKKALITGITGQDGSYLAELLLGPSTLSGLITSIVIRMSLMRSCFCITVT